MKKYLLLSSILFLTFISIKADASIFKSNGLTEYFEGREFYYNGEYQQAIDKFELAFEKGLSSRKSKKTYVMQGRSYEMLGELDRAFAVYSKGLKLYPKSIELMIENADLYYTSTGYSKAIEMYKQVLEKDKENYLAHLGLGKSYQKIGFFSKAIGYYSLYFSEAEKPDRNYYYDYAFCYFKLDNYVKTQEIIADNLMGKKTDADLLLLSAKTFYKVKNYERAFEDLGKALVLDPTRRDIELTKAFWYYSLGEYSKSENIANKYINKNGKDTLALLVKSMCLKKKNYNTKANKYLDFIMKQEKQGFIYETAKKLK